MFTLQPIGKESLINICAGRLLVWLVVFSPGASPGGECGKVLCFWCQRHAHRKEIADLTKLVSQSSQSRQLLAKMCHYAESKKKGGQSQRRRGDRMGSETEKGSPTSISYISEAHSAVVSLKCLSFQPPAKSHE